jgi:hypothetical protein
MKPETDIPLPSRNVLTKAERRGSGNCFCSDDPLAQAALPPMKVGDPWPKGTGC